jgi:hypothetical protein
MHGGYRIREAKTYDVTHKADFVYMSVLERLRSIGAKRHPFYCVPALQLVRTDMEFGKHARKWTLKESVLPVV